MNAPNYAALISAAKGGNATALEALYNTTFHGVYYTTKKITGNAQDAEELAQETYIKIFSSLDQVQDPAAFPAWANRIASNISISYLRKSRPVLFATEEQEELTLGSITETAEDFLPAEFVQTQDKREKLMAAIEELPEKQRTAIYMHYFSEMPIKDVAQELGVNENTVKSRLNAGRATIRAKLEKLGITSATVITLTAALKVDSRAAFDITAKESDWRQLTASSAAAAAISAGAGASVAASTAA
ncbi:MAG: RNA polymerase sigma factor, partial [Oscillospiraceae bacterium]|nr:RNA polymerase sigma factor [Oscillospiraceae bacterium]